MSNKQFQVVMDFIKSMRKDKDCFHPDKANCSGRIISAHTVSKASGLKPIACEGHVLMRMIDIKTGTFELKSTGVNNATTFHGFCSFHDNHAFASIDDDPQIDLRDAGLLAFRSYAMELQKKNAALNGHIKLYEGYHLTQPNLLAASIHSEELALRDLGRLREIFDNAVRHDSWEAFDYSWYKFSGTQCIGASGCFFPLFDFQGLHIQSLDDPGHLQPLFINVFAHGGDTSVVFCWAKNDKKAKSFAVSFENLTDDRKGDSLVWTVFNHLENLAISSTWWSGLRDMQQQNLTQTQRNIVGDVNSESDYLMVGTRSFIDWKMVEKHAIEICSLGDVNEMDF